MKVRAIKPGFLTRLHTPGEGPFEIEPKQFSENWMEKVKPERKKAAPKKAEEPKEEPAADE